MYIKKLNMVLHLFYALKKIFHLLNKKEGVLI